MHRYADAQNQSVVIKNCNQDNGVLLAKFILKQPSVDPAIIPSLPTSSVVSTAAPESERKRTPPPPPPPFLQRLLSQLCNSRFGRSDHHRDY